MCDIEEGGFVSTRLDKAEYSAMLPKVSDTLARAPPRNVSVVYTPRGAAKIGGLHMFNPPHQHHFRPILVALSTYTDCA
jgi:hypothetical protein